MSELYLLYYELQYYVRVSESVCESVSHHQSVRHTVLEYSNNHQSIQNNKVHYYTCNTTCTVTVRVSTCTVRLTSTVIRLYYSTGITEYAVLYNVQVL